MRDLNGPGEISGPYADKPYRPGQEFPIGAPHVRGALFGYGEPWICGQEARAYVQGAFAPSLAAVEKQMREDLSAATDDLDGLTRTERTRIAAARLRGYTEHHDAKNLAQVLQAQFDGLKRTAERVNKVVTIAWRQMTTQYADALRAANLTVGDLEDLLERREGGVASR